MHFFLDSVYKYKISLSLSVYVITFKMENGHFHKAWKLWSLKTYLYSLSRMTGVAYTGVLKILNHKNLEPLPQLSYHYNGNLFKNLEYAVSVSFLF